MGRPVRLNVARAVLTVEKKLLATERKKSNSPTKTAKVGNSTRSGRILKAGKKKKK